MALIICILTWIMAALGGFVRDPDAFYLGLLAAIVFSVACAKRFQENLKLRENLRKNLVQTRNAVINCFMKFNKIHKLYEEFDTLDRQLIQHIVNMMFMHLHSVAWLDLWDPPDYPHADNIISVTADKIAPSLHEDYDHLRDLIPVINEYNHRLYDLRLKEQSLFWLYLYSSRRFQYIDWVSLPDASCRMIEQAIHSKSFLETAEVEQAQPEGEKP